VPENIKSLQASVIARLKIMARLDIAEKRLPQDGRINLELDGLAIDVRVATIPSVEGESISLRLLAQQQVTVNRLGLTDNIRPVVDELLKLPNGIILITGPTGSGKSTTLYAFLTELNQTHRRIVTIEDPVEYKMPGIVQIAVKPEIGLTFGAGLRSILRGDPNVVMIGEMRDLETTEIAVRAALTGHLVFSTLHTNDAIGGITRLIDMGVEPFLVSSAVRAFFAQRLVRKLCPLCKTPTQVEESYLKSIGFPSHLPGQIMRGVGCEACRGSGFQGRLSIYEVCLVTHALQHLINSRAHPAEFHKQAIKDGYIPMRGYGFQKVLSGETTIEEVSQRHRRQSDRITIRRQPRCRSQPASLPKHSSFVILISSCPPSFTAPMAPPVSSPANWPRRIAARRLRCWGRKRSSRSSLKWPVMRNLLPRLLRRRSKTHRPPKQSPGPHQTQAPAGRSLHRRTRRSRRRRHSA
jgi:general secretion pathway protein E